ncbi:MAG: hypothetical protein M0D53_12455 [Flavobacterium sp. JAD_PAG50586_2]|nr:MAG: hypothetical protein M0D53_12455 [Flavobacterium sp. JAD_PAG50586_2]
MQDFLFDRKPEYFFNPLKAKEFLFARVTEVSLQRRVGTIANDVLQMVPFYLTGKRKIALIPYKQRVFYLLEFAKCPCNDDVVVLQTYLQMVPFLFDRKPEKYLKSL